MNWLLLSISGVVFFLIIPGLILATAFAVLNVALATWAPGFVGNPKPLPSNENMSLREMLGRL